MATRRSFLAAAGGLALVACGGSFSQLTGGGSSSGGGAIAKSTANADMTFSWWGNAGRDQRTNGVIDAFQKKYPQYKVAGQPNPSFQNYWDKLNTQIAGGAAPDIITMDMRYIGEYKTKQLILDLKKVGDQINLSDFDKSLLSQAEIDGGLYGVPMGGNIQAMFYNTSLFEKAGTQPPNDPLPWDQFADFCTQLQSKLPKGVWAIDDHSRDIVGFEVFVRQRGKELYTKDGKLGFDRQDVLDWFNYWQKLSKAGAAVPGDISVAGFTAAVQSDSVVGKEIAAMFLGYSNTMEAYQKFTKSKLGLVPYPIGKQGQPTGLVYKAAMLASISSKTKFPSQAAQFVDFWTNDPEAGKQYSVERGVPGSKHMQDVVAATLDDVQKIAMAYVQAQAKNTTPKTVLDPPGAGQVEQALIRNGQSIPLGPTTPEAAADKFMAEATKAVS